VDNSVDLMLQNGWKRSSKPNDADTTTNTTGLGE